MLLRAVQETDDKRSSYGWSACVVPQVPGDCANNGVSNPPLDGRYDRTIVHPLFSVSDALILVAILAQICSRQLSLFGQINKHDDRWIANRRVLPGKFEFAGLVIGPEYGQVVASLITRV